MTPEDKKKRKRESNRKWYLANKERKAKMNKDYKEKNRDTTLEYNRSYYEKNKNKLLETAGKDVSCCCGRMVRKDGLSRHKRSKIHIKYMDSI